MERFTQRARRVLSLAHQEAERMRHNYIGTEHLLLGLMREDGGIAGQVFRDLGLEVERVQATVEQLTGMGQYSTTRPELSPGTQRVLELAVEEDRIKEGDLVLMISAGIGYAWDVVVMRWGRTGKKG